MFLLCPVALGGDVSAPSLELFPRGFNQPVAPDDSFTALWGWVTEDPKTYLHTNTVQQK